MTKNNSKEKEDKAPPVRKAKKGAWWKSLSPEAEAQLQEASHQPVGEDITAAPTPVVAAAVTEPPTERTDPEVPIHSVATSPEPLVEQEVAAPGPNEPVEIEAVVIEAVTEPTPVPAIEAQPPEQEETAAPVEAQAEEATLPASTEAIAVPQEPQPHHADLQPEEPSAKDSVETGEVTTGEEQQAEETVTEESPEPPPVKKRRSRRGGKKRSKPAEATPTELTGEEEEQPITTTLESDTDDDEENDVVPDELGTDSGKPVIYKLLINAEEPEECRIAMVEDGRLESFHVTTVDREPTKNNIYKGRIVSIEANLQAAFVDIGTGRNGFLPFNEIHPEYYRQDVNDRVRTIIAQQQWKKLKIEEVMQRGQEVLVQVVKEVTGNKGANMTTYLSLPGRFLVLMPGSDSSGISRKIVGEERRASLREIMSEFEIPEGIGFIIRTASVDITHNALEKDLRSLLTLWEDIKRRGQTKDAPALVYEEQDTVVRFLRDHFIPEIQEILVDTQESMDNVNAFIEQLPSKQRQVKVRLHRGSKPIFNQYNVEEQIESIFKPQVPLPSGGSIVINPTEALVAIDVNSGRTSKNSDFDETIFLANMEAAAELARQLRLRDLGGLIVVDFIDMRNKKHIRDVERQVKVSMKRDKAKVDISKISRFGLMQISRQKMGAPIEKGSYRTCEYCQGRGVVRSVETLALYYLRRIQTGITRKKVARVECRLPLDVAQYLLNKKRAELSDLEAKHQAKVDIIPRNEMKPAESQIDFLEADPNN
ncbi:MAG: Rne/Rng family ribonuclease [Desulfobulbus sp.]|nr:Rne/Rng family ribonuclease [Desulfobulbus sp.]